MVAGPSCIPRSVESVGLYQEHCEFPPSIPVAFTWSKYLMAVILLQSAILTLLSLQIPTSELHTLRDTCQQRIQAEIDAICASIPFHLGDRTKPGAIGNKKLKYQHELDVSMPENNYYSAPALGGYQLLGPLGRCWGSQWR
jgi:hypothetical protein